MNWDHGGQLWVASTPIYPQIQPGNAPADKIYVLADKDNDGRAETSLIFADHLLIPTGIAPVPTPPGQPSTACYVGASTELLLLTDTDRDGKADRQEVIFGGFGTEDTHHNVHTLRWGPDGRLYLNQSVYTHSHLETPHGMIRLNAGGVLAYDPRSERVEVFSRGLWNSWGHAWNEEGQSILTDGAGFSGLAWAFPGAILNPSEGAERTMPTISPGRYPKYAGLELVDSAVFPADWQGHAITCDFRAHRIVRFELQDLEKQEPKRSGYITREMEPLVVTNDLAFRPIDVKHGPDGALYLADWTNPIINHGEVDFRDPRRDQSNGRIWRITRKSASATNWTPTLRPVARSTDPTADASSDSPRRRIEAMRTLARTPNAGTAKLILDLATQCPANDPYYEFAAWRSIRDVAPELSSLLASDEWKLSSPDGNYAAETLALQSLPQPLANQAFSGLLENNKPSLDGNGPWIGWIGNFGTQPNVQQLFAALQSGQLTAKSQVFTALLAAQKRGIRPANLKDTPATLFLPATPDSLRLLAAWKLDHVELLADQLDGSNELRNAAFEALATLRTPKAINTLTNLTKSPNANLRQHSLRTLATFRADLALNALPPFIQEHGANPAFWEPLLAQHGFLQQLTKSLPTNWQPATYEAALEAARKRGKQGRALVAKLEPLAGNKNTPQTPASNKTVASVITWAENGGDPAEGELIYRRPELACTLCHAIGGVGGKLGPDMSTLGASAPLDYIVESLLHPERKVKEGFHAVTYTLTDGQEVIGIPSRTSATEQFIRTTTSEQAIPKTAIKSKKISDNGGSLMPGGLLNSLNHMETRSFVNFLQQLGKPGPYDASDGGIARFWTIHPAEEDTVATSKEPTPGGTPFATLVDGRLTPNILTPVLAGRPAIFAQSRFVTTKAGKVRLKLEGVREAWINGVALPVASEPGRTLTLPAGTHTITIKLVANDLPPHARASSPDARFLTE
jgi:putative heme-binding domain-containing protein